MLPPDAKPSGRARFPVHPYYYSKKPKGLSDRETVNQVKENRYIQYFCNVPDAGLPTFIYHSSLSRIRGRIGEKGAAVIGSAVFFNILRSEKLLFNSKTA